MRLRLAAVFIAVFVAGCATSDFGRSQYYDARANGRIGQFMPLFLVHGVDRPYNRIGTPAARMEDGKEHVFVDPNRPSIFTMERSFKVGEQTYRNLIYRVHFERVPMTHLTGGRNVGLLLIVTLSKQDKPLLITALHTCGCYTATIPSDLLRPAAYPEGWKTEEVKVYGEKLPGLLRVSGLSSYRIQATIRPETHRFMDLKVLPATKIPAATQMTVEPMEALGRLQLEDGTTTSFFHVSGGKRAFVKGSEKLWETLFMSWMAWDIWIGTDKAYADTDSSGNRFYTSLKPWRRRDSDLWHFAGCLEYWGWSLDGG